MPMPMPIPFGRSALRGSGVGAEITWRHCGVCQRNAPPDNLLFKEKLLLLAMASGVASQIRSRADCRTRQTGPISGNAAPVPVCAAAGRAEIIGIPCGTAKTIRARAIKIRRCLRPKRENRFKRRSIAARAAQKPLFFLLRKTPVFALSEPFFYSR